MGDGVAIYRPAPLTTGAQLQEAPEQASLFDELPSLLVLHQVSVTSQTVFARVQICNVCCKFFKVVETSVVHCIIDIFRITHRIMNKHSSSHDCTTMYIQRTIIIMPLLILPFFIHK